MCIRDRHHADVIVFEYLEMQGKISGKKKQKLHLWRKRDIQKCCEMCIRDSTYTGKAITPTVKLTVDGVELASGIDYEIQSCSNNKNAGEATVTVVDVYKRQGADFPGSKLHS